MTLQRHNVNSRLLNPLHDPRFQGHASDPQTIARVAPTQSQPLALTISLGVTCSQLTGLQAGAALPASGSLRTTREQPMPGVHPLCSFFPPFPPPCGGGHGLALLSSFSVGTKRALGCRGLRGTWGLGLLAAQ